MEKKISIWNILSMQITVIIYSFSTVMAKNAAKEPVLSWKMIGFYAVYLLCLFVYALCWQQIIKKIDLSVAYANRCTSVLWCLVWAVILFQEEISLQNLLGVILVLFGIFLINTPGEKKDKEETGHSEKKFGRRKKKETSTEKLEVTEPEQGGNAE